MGKLGKAFVFLIVVMMLLTVASRSAASFTVVQVTVETPKAQKIEHKVTGKGRRKDAGAAGICGG